MKIINFFELDENSQVLDKKTVGSNSSKQVEAPSDEYFKEIEKSIDIAGQWLVIDELLEINNQYIAHVKDTENEVTWIKLPEKYVKEKYMVDYEAEDECPLGIDALIKEDGYPIGIITGCDSLKQAKVDNDLDGHRYKGILGIKLNKDYFLSFNQDGEEFRITKTQVDWDRGKHTI